MIKLILIAAFCIGVAGCKNPFVSDKKDTIVHAFSMKIDTTHDVPDILIGGGGFSTIDAHGKIIDSAWNDKNDSFGSDHYYFFGSKKVPQKGVVQMVKKAGDDFYECETFINGYLAYWCILSGSKIDTGTNHEVVDRYNTSQNPQSKTLITNINHVNTLNQN